MIGLPPLAGAVQVTLADPLPAVAVTLVGAPGGGSDGVTAFDSDEGMPVPIAFVADTVNV